MKVSITKTKWFYCKLKVILQQSTVGYTHTVIAVVFIGQPQLDLKPSFICYLVVLVRLIFYRFLYSSGTGELLDTFRPSALQAAHFYNLDHRSLDNQPICKNLSPLRVFHCYTRSVLNPYRFDLLFHLHYLYHYRLLQGYLQAQVVVNHLIIKQSQVQLNQATYLKQPIPLYLHQVPTTKVILGPLSHLLLKVTIFLNCGNSKSKESHSSVKLEGLLCCRLTT